ncbi:hypothetical protein dsat_0491 [Alkalidesulfovibrio alkalitolerans DSM 16529]|uniref:Uncharacterized protein n=2 Tax=Alkalidesulfovibrio alkalitolerans TaxID=293256 RepID=S7T938_9BACT|nr:hypothetical protein dsat_0491 [Alkalidesulfovibrio alkalitolerans DSM 16529]
MFTSNRNGTDAAHGRRRHGSGQAMSTGDFIREAFEQVRREHVPDGHLLMEHLKDEEYSTEDAMGVTFGNRGTLQRLYDQGKVKPESDALFREALGLPPRAQPTAASAAGSALARAPGAAAHEARRLHEKQSAAPSQSVAPAAPSSRRQAPGVAAAIDRTADGIGTAARRAWDTVTGNEDLHEGAAKGFKMAGKVAVYAGGRIAEDVLTATAMGRASKIARTVPQIGGMARAGIDAIASNKKYLDVYDDFNNLPGEMRELGSDLARIGKRTRNRR